MSTVLPKSEMSEEDVKLQYITPAITSKWDRGKITMETQITDGKINLKGNFVFREKPKRADYILYLNANNPIAIIEAKDNKHSISHGLQQAMTYARMLDLPFAYSSNGDGFAEHDFLTGKERQLKMDEFPTEVELISRFKEESGMTSTQEEVIEQPYYSSQNTYPPSLLSAYCYQPNRRCHCKRAEPTCCLLWLPVRAKLIPLFRSFTVCCKAA